MDDVFVLIADGLRATYADAGLPNEIDWTTRLLSCAALLNLFPKGERKTPEQVRELLERALPASVRVELSGRLTPETIRATARAQWQELKDRRGPLASVYETDPPWLKL